jgi:hypothetical protein
MTDPTPAKKKGGLKISQCPWCGGETREGEALVNLTSFAGRVPSVFATMARAGMPRFGVPTGEITGEEKMLWREKTGSKTGWLKRSDEEKTMKISGRRCTICGHIEFYAREST